MKQNWISELPKLLKKRHERDDYTAPEIIAATACLRGSNSNEVLMRAFRFLLKMGLIVNVGGGRFLFDKVMIKNFTEGAESGKTSQDN